MTPAPRKPSPNSPATNRTGPGPATPRNPAVAARVRQLAAQAGHRRAIAEFRARRAADQQDRVNALLLEAIAALASLLRAPGPHPSPASRPQVAIDSCQNMNTECCRLMCKHRGHGSLQVQNGHKPHPDGTRRQERGKFTADDG
jgi:hypothetical protein